MTILEKKIKSAGRAVIFNEKNETAIIDVRGGEYFKIPGGGVEAGESIEETVRRESMEEAGVEIEILDKLGEQEFIDPENENLIHHSNCFLARTIGESKNPNFDAWEKSNDFRLMWVDYEKALELFASSKAKDKFGENIWKRDLEFLKKGGEINFA